MSARHWHWTWRINDYHSMFTYPNREAAEIIMNKLRKEGDLALVRELPCTCDEMIRIEETAS